ncbi:unnamed protein product [Vitrella brassicaformis CCMP3155]|uniref:TRP C-terminal domain-containing protein n=3 Tax=Vitrella brassicaformis TaxID=1169539 RepID=A0A0G4GIF6_VITBC|nr:unnamed protein product [Vitrella brassicaformis CCMP3155]|eukprot:CEM29628.1 unnamed protein product [Vitrella brassicaformis CCMP3155]
MVSPRASVFSDTQEDDGRRRSSAITTANATTYISTKLLLEHRTPPISSSNRYFDRFYHLLYNTVPMDMHRICNVYLLIINALYISLCTNSFIVFQCYQHPWPNNRWSLVEFPDVLCHDDFWFKNLLPLGLFGINCYVVGVLCFFSWLNWNAPKFFHTHPGFRIRYRFLLADFRLDVWYWGIVFLVRNTLLTVTPLIAHNDGNMQATVLICILTFFLVLHVFYWPWASPANNVLDTVILCGLIIVSGVGSYFADRHEDKAPVFAYLLLTVFVLVNLCCVACILWAIRMHRKKVFKFAQDEDVVRRLMGFCAYAEGRGQKELTRKFQKLPRYDHQQIERTVNVFEMEMMGLLRKPTGQSAKQSKRSNRLITAASQLMEESKLPADYAKELGQTFTELEAEHHHNDETADAHEDAVLQLSPRPSKANNALVEKQDHQHPQADAANNETQQHQQQQQDSPENMGEYERDGQDGEERQLEEAMAISSEGVSLRTHTDDDNGDIPMEQNEGGAKAPPSPTDNTRRAPETRM